MRKLILLAILPLLLAYGFQWYGEAHPCKFCYYERYIFMALAASSLAGVILKKEADRILWSVILVILVLGIIITGYHIGIEQGWVKDAGSCSSGSLKDTFRAFKNAIEGKDLVACDQPYYVYKGVTLAQLNLLYLSGLLIYVTSFKWSRR